MKLIRFGELGNEKPGLLDAAGERIDASAFVADYDEAFFASGGLERLRAWACSRAGAAAPRVDTSVRWGAPIARPSKIVCIGLNYRDHARETGAALPAEPIVFFKATTALAGPYDDLVLPRGSTKTDWEVELAVIIGRRARYVAESEALDHVAGYALHNDYSERAFQLERGGQWVKGKSADTFAPLGPCLCTRDEVADEQNLSLWLSVNGESMQRGNTRDMIFGVRQLVSYVSEFMTLLPGDVISTGTPAGVGMGRTPQRYLAAGDVCELGVDGLGSARQRVVAWRG
ncbi:MAG TPA: fumarylacetoacetate hydrolase family protein [Polyangiaceae bacterium]|nr:fumarylacetoacetate hydrolase family protein [Polyangiaceae bacterium]